MKDQLYEVSSCLDDNLRQEILEDMDLAMAWYLFCENNHGGQGSDTFRCFCLLGEDFKPGAAWKSDPKRHTEEVREHYRELCLRNLGQDCHIALADLEE